MIHPKKLTAFLTSSVLSVILLSVTALAYTGAATVKVNTSLNVRQYAGTGASIIGGLKNGTSVNILSTSGSWYRVSYSGGTGWVYGSYVTVTNSDKIETVVDTANDMLGVKYVYGSASPSAGFDCSGLVLYAYQKVGVTLPHRAALQASYGKQVARSALSAGDLVFFDTDGGNNNITHVGIYVGNGYVIQAQTGSVQKVAKISLSNSYWSSAYMTARRLIY